MLVEHEDAEVVHHKVAPAVCARVAVADAEALRPRLERGDARILRERRPLKAGVRKEVPAVVVVPLVNFVRSERFAVVPA